MVHFINSLREFLLELLDLLNDLVCIVLFELHQEFGFFHQLFLI